MNFEQLELESQNNYLALKANPYSGRGIVIGRTSTHFVQIYWISGRGESSRNRVFVKGTNGQLRTSLADPAKHSGDTSLIIYNAMRETGSGTGKWFVVSNGAQTDDVVDHYHIAQYPTLSLALARHTYEPDAPNYTPRITGVCRFNSLPKSAPPFELSILRHDPSTGKCERQFFQYDDIPVGFGRCITTYSGDAPSGQPLPAFRGEPLLLPIESTTEEILRSYWDAVSFEHRVAMAVKTIDMGMGSSTTTIFNRFSEVATEKVDFAHAET